MDQVEGIPHIDPNVRHIGVSKLRGLNADKLRDTQETFVIQENDQPLAVLLTYEKFLAMQTKIRAVTQLLDLVNSPAELEAFRKGLEDLQAGRVSTPTKGAAKRRG